jgi:hypothetical protein
VRRLPSATFIAALAVAVALCLVAAASAAASMVQVDQFGAPGTGAGQLSNPTQIAVNETTGETYVVESFNRRVSVFDSDGRFLRMWGWDVDADQPGTGFEICDRTGSCKTGAFGSGTGQLGNPAGIAVNETTGDVYVAELSNRRVQQFDAEGNPIRAWGWNVDATTPGTEFEICPATDTCQAGSGGNGNGQFAATNGNGRIAIDRTSGEVYVADPGNSRIEKFDAQGNFLTAIGSAGSGPGQFPSHAPYYIGLDSSGHLYAGGGLSGNGITEFDSAGNFVAKLEVPPLLGSETVGIAVDQADDHLYVARVAGPETVIQELDSAGTPVGTHAVGERFTSVQGLGLVSSPQRLLVANGNVVSVLGEAAPEAIAAGVAPRTDTGARLNGYVDPNGSATSYRFEYGLDSTYGTSVPAGPGAEAGSGAGPIPVSRQLTGLRPGSTYHYRVVAEWAGGTVASPDRTFSTRTPAEMSPPARGIELVSNPNKGNQNVSTTEGQSFAPDGSQAYWIVAGGAPGATTGSNNLFLATRSNEGWSSIGVTPPPAEQFGNGDYHYKLLEVSKSRRQFLFFVDQGILSPTPYALARVDLDRGSTILQEFPTGNVDDQIKLVNGNADDLSHVVYPNPADGQLYDYGSGEPKLVSVLPNGSPPSCGIAERYGWHPNENSWLAADGSRAFFISAGDDCSSPPRLYQRNLATETTVPVAPVPDHGPLGDTVLIKASADARRAIFISETALVPGDENSNWDIYRYSEAAPLDCLTCDLGDAQVKTVGLFDEQPVMVSDDLSHVYFLSRKPLLPGARPSSDNVYVWSGGQVRFVTATTFTGEWNTTPDGSKLLLESEDGRLTTDETGNSQQLYLYDDGNGSIECVSCSRSGASTVPVGDPNFPRSFRQLSADGSTVAFVTVARLVPEDVNGTGDVYEWRDGVLRLVTDGETKFPIGLADALPRGIDETGQSILFSAAARLTGFEEETTANLYVARIGGGFTPKVPPPRCVEDSCQGPLQAPPALPGAGSAGVDGGGNLREKSAARKHRKKHRKHAKKRHARKKGHAKKRANAKHGVARHG